MNPHDSQDAKEQVRQATDIVDLVGGYMQLRRQGRGYVGLCPWHDDTRPSMQVNPDRQSFKCWVCDIGGDIFSFAMRIEGLEFREALELLADKAGISLEAQQGPRAEPGSPGDKKTLFDAMAWAEERYHRCLLEATQADPARRYLNERGVSAESIARFRIGFAPTGWDWLLKQAPAASFTPAVLDRVNLIAARKGGEGWYDQFRGRLMFPIRDIRSRPVAFGGRVLPELAAAEAESNPDYKPAKYVNSSETPIYSKSHTLYAMDLARDAVQRHEQLAVVEGYTDVVAAHQNGVENVVACCGTAMGEGQLKLVRRFTDRLILVLDGDNAGRKRASELLELFIESPIDLRILTLPNGVDPCDFIASHGGDKFGKLLDAAPDALEHKLQSVTNGMVLSADNTHAVSQAVEQLLGTLAKTRTSLGEASSTTLLREQSLLGRLARHFRLPEEGLRSRLADIRKNASRKPLVASEVNDFDDAAPSLRAANLPAWDREVLELILTEGPTAKRLVDELGEVDFLSPLGRRVFQYCRDVAEQGEATFDRFLLACENETLKGLLVELDEGGRGRSASDPERRLHDLLQGRATRQEDAQHGEQVSTIQKGELEQDAADEALIALFASRKRRETGPLSTDG